MPKIGIMGKVFIYTLMFLALVVGVSVIMFARQFTDYYNELRVQSVREVFDPLRVTFESGNLHDIVAAAEDFHNKNQSYDFSIQNAEGVVIYRASGVRSQAETMQPESAAVTITVLEKSETGKQPAYNNDSMFMGGASGSGKTVKNLMLSRGDGLILMATVTGDDESAKKALYQRVITAVLLLLALSAVCALLFARGITGPIKRLALDTKKMAALEDVPLAGDRYDEVGQLERAVHNMYGALKENIAMLEFEIKKVKDMESSQRYFFSMASHELKTPIAAASALLEGMLAEVGDFKNRSKYLRECIRLMQSQNKIVTELLEIVKLSDVSIKPVYETFDLSELIRSILPEYEALAQQKDQRITVDVTGEVKCYSDRIMLGRALSNILMNAVQNSPDREGIEIWAAEGELCILNTGVSIDEDVREHIFEPFFRTDLARSRTSAKSGLGLTIVSKIFDQLNITYRLINTAKGVMFAFSIPDKAGCTPTT